MLSQAVTELENKLLKLSNISYNSIDSLMRKIMKSYNITAKELHNAFKSKNKKTPDNWVKEKMKKLQEDHKEIASGKQQDDEGYMARNELDTIEKAIKNLRKSIKSGNQQLPAWVQSKITKAADYIDTASDYLESDESVDENVSFKISSKHKQKTTQAKIHNMTTSPNSNEASVAKSKLNRPESLPSIKKEEISLVEKILGEEKCGKGMYWCNTDKKCKPFPTGFDVPGQSKKPTEVGIGKPVAEGSCNHTKKGKSCSVHGTDQCPMSEEKDPKGPVKSYKSPEELSKKHGVSVEEIKKQLEIGTKVEFEHTTSKSSARITALQHLDEKPDYYTKLKKMETQKESNTVRDANGNVYAEFIDIIKSGSIEEENPCWKDYRKVGTKKKGGKEVPNCVPEEIQLDNKAVDEACWKGYKKKGMKTMFGKKYPNCVPVKEGNIDEAVRLPAQTGNNIFVTLSWRGKYYTMQLFFPQAKIPSRVEISDEMQKIYPGSRVVTYRVADFKPGEPIIYAYRGGDAGKLGPNKNYVKPMSEEREIEPPKEKVDALTNINIPKSEREAARLRTIAKAKAQREKREQKGEVEISEIKKVEEDWQKVNRQDKTDGLSQKAVNAYKKENPGSKLKTAVTEKKPGGKRAKRRSSFCSRMSGMKSKLTSAKTARDPNSRINKALRRWRCN